MTRKISITPILEKKAKKSTPSKDTSPASEKPAEVEPETPAAPQLDATRTEVLRQAFSRYAQGSREEMFEVSELRAALEAELQKKDESATLTDGKFSRANLLVPTMNLV